MSMIIIRKARTAIRMFRDATYRYSDKKYPNSFMSKYTSSYPSKVGNDKIERVIYVFWTGENEMSENRKRCLFSMVENTGVKVILVTPKNLDAYIVREDPLPECYQYLSANHKSDYLRVYFMHHYGGGYSDVKEHRYSWIPVFEQFEKSNAYICGYRDIGPNGI